MNKKIRLILHRMMEGVLTLTILPDGERRFHFNRHGFAQDRMNLRRDVRNVARDMRKAVKNVREKQKV